MNLVISGFTKVFFTKYPKYFTKYEAPEHNNNTVKVLFTVYL